MLETLHFDKFNGCDFKYQDNLKKKKTKEIFGIGILFLHQILGFDKFELSDFNYDNCVSKFHPKNSKIMHFWSQLLRFFVLHKTLYFDKFNGGDFKYNNSFFQFQL